MSDQARPEMTSVQRYIFDIFKAVVDLLEGEGIPYFMQGGTMLGAIRHQGFIPWDDDVDIAIPRSAYDRFLASCGDKLPEHLELRTYWDETDHHYYFARIVDNRYQIKRMGSLETRLENVWIDIFPLDGMPQNPVVRRIHELRLTWARLCYHLSCIEKVNIKRPGRPLVERMVIRVATVIPVGKLFNTRRMLDKMDRLLRKYPPEESDLLVNFTGQTSYHFNEMLPKTIYGSGRAYPFESASFIGPEDYDAYLTSLYGDYMVPPKEGDRNAHVSELVEKQ